MLNQALVAELQAIATEQRNGSLLIGLGSRKVRFGFENGELVLLDLGEEKEVAMARKLLDYHKIGPEIHRHAVNTARATGASIIETLRRQQLVADNEIDMVAQAMVEDLLSLVFSLTHSDLSFNEDQVDSYDLDKQAVRLRIDVESLITGVQARVTEEDAILEETGGYASVFELDEGSNPDDLDEFERHVLNMIDGRKSIENLAVAFRDSDINMARHLAILLRKGAIRRSVGAASERRAAVSSAAGRNESSSVNRVLPDRQASSTVVGQGSTAPGEDPNASSFEVYRPQNEGSTNVGARVALAVVFVVVVAIGYMVMSYSREQGRVKDSLSSISDAITARDWATAYAGMSEAEAKHGSDLAILKRIGELKMEMETAIAQDAAQARDAITNRDFEGARRRIDRLPSDFAGLGELNQTLSAVQKEFDDNFARLERVVRERLDQGSVAQAFAVAEGEEEQLRDRLLVIIDRWRLASIEQASLSNLAMGRRQQLINLVQQAKPTETQKERINSLQAELLRYQTRRQEQLVLAKDALAQGDWVAADGMVQANGLLDQVPGSDLEKEAKALVDGIAARRKELEALVPAVRESITKAVDLRALARTSKALQAALDAYPAASNRADLESLAELINALQPVLGSPTTEEEVSGLRKLAAATSDPAVAKAISSRIVTIDQAQVEAAGALDNARTQLRDGQWDEAFTSLERIRNANDWRRTPAGRQVDEIIAQAKIDKEKHLALDKKFHDALTSGDISGAYAMARELGRPYLPVMVESVPSGAEVMRDGKMLGKTPLILEITASERVEMTIVIQMSGYTPLELNGANAIGGWRMAGDLERKPSAVVDIGELITSQPGSSGSNLWMANNRVVVRVASNGDFKTLGFGEEGDPGLDNPVYASPTLIDGNMQVVTRDKLILRVAPDGTTTRLKVPVASDLAPAIYRSPMILDREYCILAATNGSVVACDPRDATAGWKTAPGSAIVSAPVVLNERVLVARRDGTLLAIQVDRGEILEQVSLPTAVIAVWPTETGLQGYTQRSAFTWDGGQPKLTTLPREIVAADRGLLVTTERQVLLEVKAEWQLVGALSGRVNGQPLRWGDRAVIPEGDVMEVLGPNGFRLTTEAAFLNPVLVGDRLALVTSAGHVQFYDPR